jgi:hypothetical protein
MKMKDLLLLLLTIIFVILSIFYIVSVCNYDIKELFIDKYSAIGVKCNLDDPLVQINDLRNDAKYTSEVLRGNGKVIEVIDDYHTAYKCDTDTYNNQYLTKYTDIRNRDLLLAYGCIKIDPTQLINMTSDINSYKVMLTDPKLTYVEYANTTELINKIDAKIKTVIRDTSLLNEKATIFYFPVYVFISQAPYLKNNIENLKVTDSNRGADGTNYESCSTNYITKNNDKCPDTFRMKASVAIIFSGLTKTGAIISDIGDVNRNTNKLRNKLSEDNIKSNSKQCFLNCGTDDSKHACGCLNLYDSYTVDKKKYNSACLTDNTPTSMTMVYFVNPYANNFSNEKYTAGGQTTDKTNSLSAFGWYGA